MNSSKRSFFLYRAASLAVTVVAILLRTINLLFFYEKEIGYYQAGSVLPVVTDVVIVFGTVFFALFSAIGLRENPPAFSARTKSTAVAPFVAAMGLVLFAVGILSIGAGSSFDLPLLVTSILGAVYFVLYARKWGSSVLHFVCGTALIVFLALLLMDSYFDISVQMNAPVKLALQIGCIGGMLLMLSEIRLICGYPAPRFSAFSNSCAALFLGAALIPTLIADAFSRLPTRRHFLSDLVFFGLFLLALARLTVPAENEVNDNAQSPSLDTETENDTDGDQTVELSQD